MALRSTRRLGAALFLGLDSSTQGLKVTAINEALETVYTNAINFDRDLPEFKTSGGVHERGDAVVTTPAAMLPTALQAILDRMKQDEFPFKDVVMISGSGQQHGSVYWSHDGVKQLSELKPELTLAEQLQTAFATADCPIWMDSSTSRQCRELEEAVGGAQALAELTGSSAYERFTANQILKKKQEQTDVYNSTAQISLISSAMCSLLLGKVAPIDTSDGAGMNLMSLATEDWAPSIVEHIDPDLLQKLQPPVSAHSIVGTIAPYFSSMYGFSDKCMLAPWSGDNPNSVAGLGLKEPGDVGVSLGTSDTIFSIISKQTASPGIEGHFFPNPVDTDSYMAMLCYKNGSLSRESVAQRVAAGNWDSFAELVESRPAGNDGYVGFFIDRPEIIPHILKAGVRRFDANDQSLSAFPDEAIEARAVLEGQFMSMRVHGEQLGLTPKTIIATGGASNNPTITRVLSSVFGCPVLVAKQSDSASLGAAYRAMQAYRCHQHGRFVPFEEAMGRSLTADHHVVAVPDLAQHQVYTDLVPRYKRLEAIVCSD
eukprot:TRINITY_DN12048_c0_g1_i1.p1 TRINITY_DN12048_c0_g1~~TRINITY_DN12048_c0_g1_i1.p1  ORF type:complete len:542 (+),score=99.08 TRINITY_DN12048_c0_g1_i1:41-1666(+)